MDGLNVNENLLHKPIEYRNTNIHEAKPREKLINTIQGICICKHPLVVHLRQVPNPNPAYTKTKYLIFLGISMYVYESSYLFYAIYVCLKKVIPLSLETPQELVNIKKPNG